MRLTVSQAYAAQELYAREWRFHSVLKLWFKRVTAADVNVPPGVQYMYFDHNDWERQFFAGNVQMTVSYLVLFFFVLIVPPPMHLYYNTVIVLCVCFQAELWVSGC